MLRLVGDERNYVEFRPVFLFLAFLLGGGWLSDLGLYRRLHDLLRLLKRIGAFSLVLHVEQTFVRGWLEKKHVVLVNFVEARLDFEYFVNFCNLSFKTL